MYDDYLSADATHMGTDIHPVGNHNIDFAGKPFKIIADEIKKTLDSLIFPNHELLRLCALHVAQDSPRQIRRLKEKKDWHYWEEDEYRFRDNEKIEFYGPFDLEIDVSPGRITFFDSPYRYYQWFEVEDGTFRDEWRKYMQHVIKAFGGDRLIYLADNSHPLEAFVYDYEDKSFEELEEALLQAFGPPAKSFKEVAADPYNTYFTDDFSSIDWSRSYLLDGYLPEPTTDDSKQ